MGCGTGPLSLGECSSLLHERDNRFRNLSFPIPSVINRTCSQNLFLHGAIAPYPFLDGITMFLRAQATDGLLLFWQIIPMLQPLHVMHGIYTSQILKPYDTYHKKRYAGFEPAFPERNI